MKLFWGDAGFVRFLISVPYYSVRTQIQWGDAVFEVSAFSFQLRVTNISTRILFRVVGDNRGVRWFWDEWSLRSLLFLQADDWQSAEGSQCQSAPPGRRIQWVSTACGQPLVGSQGSQRINFSSWRTNPAAARDTTAPTPIRPLDCR